MPSEFLILQGQDMVGVYGKPRPRLKPTDPYVDYDRMIPPGQSFHAMSYEELRALPEGVYLLGADGKLRPKPAS